MNPLAPILASLGAEIARLTAEHGRRVNVETLGITDRRGQLPLRPPGVFSPNRACRLVRAADGWIAVNLARDEDRDLIPAWLEAGLEPDLWAAIVRLARRRDCADLLAGAVLLGLPVGRVGEVRADSLEAPSLAIGQTPGPASQRAGLRVVDLSALWAGPLCGAILAEMGASVVKIESARRPDPTRTSAPDFFRRLNGAKRHLSLDLTQAEGQARLAEEVLAADVFITSARPRAFASLGLSPESLFAANPRLVWVAITGYGWAGEAAVRVAFGDDAAAAGGLLRWTADGAPRFLGDALSDPVTGLAAAVGALKGVARGAALVDVALARSAAGAAAALRLRQAP